ncbi:MAG: hypothetical protein WCC14_15680 [Acidobacteriaceae bacterium]
MQATASLNLKAHSVPSTTSSIVEASSFAQNANPESLSLRDYGNCIQGFVVGLCLEAMLALGLYGVYHIGHFVR